MRHLTKIALLALLALPLGKAFAATNTLNVNITVTIAATIDVTFADASTTKAWNLSGGITFGTSYDSTVTNAIDDNIKNNTANIDSVNVTAAVTAQGNWTLDQVGSGSIGTKNHFAITTDSGLKLTNAPQAYIATINGGSTTSTNKLNFLTPTSVSTVNSGTITVSFVAAAN